MAGLVYELLEESPPSTARTLDVEVIPGVTAASAATPCSAPR